MEMEEGKQQIENVLSSALEFDLKDLDWEPVEATYLARAAATCQTS